MRRYKQDHRNPRRLRYGWRLSESGHILIDPLQRECIFLILHLRCRHLTLNQICMLLNEQHWPAPRSARWYCTTVKNILEQNHALRPLLPHMLARRHWSFPSDRP